MTREDLIARHTARWGFRPRGPFEGAQQYRDAVIAFLETRDWAASFEVRIGKPQPEWSTDEARAFEAHMMRPRRGPGTDPVPAVFVEAGRFPCIFETLRLLAHAGFEVLAALRRKDPLASVPIYAHAVLLDGTTLVTITSSGDRLGVLKGAAQQLPLYGYVLVFDAFIHSIDRVSGTATKRDALLAHLGTREERHVLDRAYTVAGRTVTFDAERDLDLRTGNELDSFVDPYAELFVSVPPVARPQ
jgi:hypothetical protein